MHDHSAPTSKALHQRGFSLTEILLVTAILGTIALVAIPQSSTSDVQILDLATQQVVDAIRFTHAESIRREETLGVYINASDQQLKLYTWDSASNPANAIYNINHPVEKRSYALDFNDHSMIKRVSIDIVNFQFSGGDFSSSNLLFAASSGVPRFQSQTRLLSLGQIILSVGGHNRTINIEPVTGRVTVL